MKKILKALMTFNTFVFSFNAVGCKTTQKGVSYENANHMYVLEKVFSTNDEDKVQFKVFPTLNSLEKQNPESIEKFDQLIFSNNYLKFDCKSFDCSPKDFVGSSIDVDTYNSPQGQSDFKEIAKIQTAYDELAYWFKINPFQKENESILYDFEFLTLKNNFEESIFYFSKAENEQLKLFSEQTLELSDPSVSLSNDFTFILEDTILNLDTLNSLLVLAKAEVETENKTLSLIPKEKPEPESTRNDEKVKDNFYSTKEIEKEITKILFNYQSNLLFKKPQPQKSEFEVDSESGNLDKFKIANTEIEKIVIKKAKNIINSYHHTICQNKK